MSTFPIIIPSSGENDPPTAPSPNYLGRDRMFSLISSHRGLLLLHREVVHELALLLAVEITKLGAGELLLGFEEGDWDRGVYGLRDERSSSSALGRGRGRGLFHALVWMG